MVGWRGGLFSLLLAVSCGGSTHSGDAGSGGSAAGSGGVSASSPCGGPLTFDDPLVNEAVLRALRRSSGPVTAEEALLVTELVAHGASSLTGVECLVNLSTLVAANGTLSSLAPVAGLLRLRNVNVMRNAIRDLTPLSGKPELQRVAAPDNLVDDLSGVTLPPSRCSELDLIRNAVDASDVQGACAAGWWVAWGDGSSTDSSCNPGSLCP